MMPQIQKQTALETLTRSLKSIFLVLHVLSFAVVSQVASEAYMDEIFHVPQAQAYCRGDFTYWDDKITTPPGLYTP
jgi:alpha-1,2-glucosyltransferase